MIKFELILRIAARNPHLHEKDVVTVVNTVLGRISDALVAGDRVEIRGLGTFSVRSRDARAARNPKTGVRVWVPMTKTVAFRPAKGMQARINPSPASAETGRDGETTAR